MLLLLLLLLFFLLLFLVLLLMFLFSFVARLSCSCLLVGGARSRCACLFAGAGACSSCACMLGAGASAAIVCLLLVLARAVLYYLILVADALSRRLTRAGARAVLYLLTTNCPCLLARAVLACLVLVPRSVLLFFSLCSSTCFGAAIACLFGTGARSRCALLDSCC